MIRIILGRVLLNKATTLIVGLGPILTSGGLHGRTERSEPARAMLTPNSLAD